MTCSNSRLFAIGTALILILTVPSLAGIDVSMDGNGNDPSPETLNINDPRTSEIPIWVSEVPVQIPRPSPTERPWWEITTRDMNRNRIVDSLEFVTESVPVVVSYSHTPGEAEITALTSLGIKGGYIIEAIDAISIGMTESTLFSDLASQPGVVMVEPSGAVHLLSDVATQAIKARESVEYSPDTAWAQFNVTGNGINIAVVDTGIDDGHPGLAGKRVAGYDAVTPLARTDGRDNPDDRHGHGTSCSGIATGTSAGDPELRYKGAAPNASLVDVQIGTDVGAGPFENYLLPTTYYDSALKGIEWVRDNAHTEWDWVEPEQFGIDVMSLSWGITSHEDGGSDGSDPFSRLIDEVVDQGVVCVGAAGNDGPNNDGMSGMSASSKAIIVGATNDLNTIDRSDDIIAGYSSRGPRRDNNDDDPYDELKPDVSAPGTNINNVEPCTWPEYGDAEDKGYEARGSGTSYATPAVAGVVALILEANGNLTPAQVKSILHLTSERRGPASLPDLDPFWNRDFGYGMVDAYEAVKLAVELRDEELDAIDIKLQAHFTNVSEGVKGNATLYGLAWAKIGTIDRVEISIDDGQWKEVLYLDAPNGTLDTDEYLNWKFEVTCSQLSWKGNHTAKVRAVSKDFYSLPDSIQFFGKGEQEEDSGIGSFEVALLSVMVLGGLLAVAAVVVKRKEIPEEENVEWEFKQ